MPASAFTIFSRAPPPSAPARQRLPSRGRTTSTRSRATRWCPVGSHTLRVVEHAYDVLERHVQPIEKTIWGSPAGKKRIAERLVAMLPAHKTYVEPFAGSAAVLFAKEPSAVEVINDADPEIARAYKILKALTARDLGRLRKMNWVGDEATFKGLIDETP